MIFCASSHSSRFDLSRAKSNAVSPSQVSASQSTPYPPCRTTSRATSNPWIVSLSVDLVVVCLTELQNCE